MINEGKMCECGHWIGCGGLYRQDLPRETIHLNAAAESEHIQLKSIWPAHTQVRGRGCLRHKRALGISAGSFFLKTLGIGSLLSTIKMKIVGMGQSFSKWLLQVR